MRKILKLTSIILGILVFLAVVGLSVLVTCVSPNRFKPLIASQAAKYTDRQLTIDGDLSWEFFPYFGVKVGHMTLSNPAEFKEKVFAEVNHATIGVKLLPLLDGKIQSSGVKLDGVILNLIKDADGNPNWQFSPTKINAGNTASVQVSSSQNISPNPSNVEKQENNKITFVMSLDVPSVDITNTQIHWSNVQAKQSVDLDNVELHAKNIHLDQAFPISGSLKFAIQNPARRGEINFDGNVNVDLKNKLYQVNNLDFVIQTQQANQKISLALSGDVIADLANDTLVVNRFASHLANLLLNGILKIDHLQNNPLVSGHVKIDSFDLKKFLQSINQDVASLEMGKNVSADFDFDFISSGDKTALQKMNLIGVVKAEEFKTDKLLMDTISVKTQLKNGVLALSPITASLYEGSLQADANLNFNAVTPQISVQAKLININMKSLLANMKKSESKIKIKGIGTVSINVTTSGLSQDVLTKNLNGNASLSLKEGVIEGVNIGKLADSAYALARHEAAPTDSSDNTNFGNLSATAVIQKGILTNNDLLLDSPRFDTKGKGSIDLVNQQIDYQLQTTSKEAAQNKGKNILNIYNLTIPIRITGNLSNPTVKVDSSDIAKQIAKQQIQHLQENVKDKLKDVIKNKLPGDAGALLKNLIGS